MIDALRSELLQEPMLPWSILIIRLGGATLLCGLIGIEREVRGQAAGLRTHILVGLAAAVYTLITVELINRADSYPDIARTDPIRVIEAVTGGVAFLAAGMIVFTGDKVKGLTTGAGLWMAASIGVAAGLGLWPLAVLSTVLALTVIRILWKLEPRGGSRNRSDR